MANMKKIETSNLHALFRHVNRTENDGVNHSNKDIDNERTHLNYYLKKGSVKELERRVSEVYHIERKNLIKCFEVVITLPKEVRPEDEEKFFRAVYEYLAIDYGEENIINAVVHKDEISVHMHVEVVPTLPIDLEALKKDGRTGKIKGIEKWMKEHPDCHEMLNGKEKMSRVYLKSFHPKLQEYVNKKLGYETGILNGATANGNKTVLELKNQKLQFECDKLEQRIQEKQRMLEHIDNLIKNNTVFSQDYLDFYELVLKEETEAIENVKLRKIIKDEGIDLDKYGLVFTFAEKFGDAQGTLRSRYGYPDAELDRSRFMLTNEDFVTTEGAKLLEIHSTMREDYNIDILKQFPEVEPYLNRENPNELIIIGEDKNRLVLFPTSSPQETVKLLIDMYTRPWAEFCDERGSISICPISNDRFMLTERILGHAQFYTRYFVNEDSAREKCFKQFDEMDSKTNRADMEEWLALKALYEKQKGGFTRKDWEEYKVKREEQRKALEEREKAKREEKAEKEPAKKGLFNRFRQMEIGK